MKVLSAAVTFAAVFAERPMVKQHEVQQRSQGEPLGICCLKAKDYTDANGGRKKELFVDWVSTNNPRFNPSKDCLLTSTVPDGKYWQNDKLRDSGEKVGFGEKKVWPTVVDGHDADEACARMMSRYPLYHDEIIKQANADKVVDDDFRKKENDKLVTQHNAQMYEIHKKYKTGVAQEGYDVGRASAQVLQDFMKDESEDAKKLKEAITLSMKELEQKDKTLSHKDRPADDITFANEIAEASERTSQVVFKMVADHNNTLMNFVDTATRQVLDKMSQFNTTSSALNAQRLQDENDQKTFKAAEEERMNAQEREEAEVIRQLEAAKAAKAPTEIGPPQEIDCTKKECCCTMKFEQGPKGRVVDVKVATNFLNWDQCQFAGQAPTNWIGGSKCSGYMTDCLECAKREQCHNQERQGCAVVAQTSVDLEPKSSAQQESAAVAETVAASPVVSANVATETVQSPPPNTVVEPVATPPTSVDTVQSSPHEPIVEPVATPPTSVETVQSPPPEPIVEPVATPPAVAGADASQETVQSSSAASVVTPVDTEDADEDDTGS